MGGNWVLKTPQQTRLEYQRQWHARNPGKQREYHQRAVETHVRARVIRFEEYRKTRCCERCGFADFRALEFHHRDPSQKLFSIGYAVRRMNWNRVEAEIAKCDVLCANCHRIEHYGNLDHHPRNGVARGDGQLALENTG